MPDLHVVNFNNTHQIHLVQAAELLCGIHSLLAASTLGRHLQDERDQQTMVPNVRSIQMDIYWEEQAWYLVALNKKEQKQQQQWIWMHSLDFTQKSSRGIYCFCVWGDA